MALKLKRKKNNNKNLFGTNRDILSGSRNRRRRKTEIVFKGEWFDE